MAAGKGGRMFTDRQSQLLQDSTAHHSVAQHSTAQLFLLLYAIRLAGWLQHCNLSLSLSTAQHSTAQHSSAQLSSAPAVMTMTSTVVVVPVTMSSRTRNFQIVDKTSATGGRTGVLNYGML